jgi:1-acyl-sn-glycerol-3-phosphate acyltransferase
MATIHEAVSTQRMTAVPPEGAPAAPPLPAVPGAPDADELRRPATFFQKVEAALRAGGVLAAAVPTTSVPPMAVTALFYHRFRDEERFHRLHKMLEWAAFCIRHVLQMDVRVDGLDRLPTDRRRLMFVSNHQSYVDIPLIMGSLRIGAFLSKDLVAYLPVIGQIAWLGGTIYFRRRDPESRRRALQDVLRMCTESTPVVVFPEGTRTRDGELRQAVRPGALRAAWEHGLRIGTFAVDGTWHVFPPSMDRFYAHQRVAIVVGDTLDPADYPDGDAYAAAAWDAVKRDFVRARALRSSPDWEHLPAVP